MSQLNHRSISRARRRLRFASIAVGALWMSLGMVVTSWAQSYTFSTLAGMPPSGSVDGTGTAARFNQPRGTAVDSAGNLYIADKSNHAIRKITPAGVVTTFAGLAGTPGSADGTGSGARFRHPTGIAVDGSGTVYVADRDNHTIRKITSAGVVTTLAGLAGFQGSVGGNGSAARFNRAYDVAVSSTGNVIVADTGNHTIRRITPAGDVSTLAGVAGSNGSADGTGLTARFNNPQGVAVDSLDAIYVADSFNNTIRKVTSGGSSVITLAGAAGSGGHVDANGASARFEEPRDVVVDASFNVYVVEGQSDVRKITPANDVTTLAGSPGAFGTADGTGSAARFVDLAGLAITSDGATLYVTDETAVNIRAITVPGAVVTTFAGAVGSFGFADGTGTAARFSFPGGVTIDSVGMLYVTDAANSIIRKMTASGTVTTLAGTPGIFGSADGTGSAAEFNFPWSSVVDSAGNVFVVDGGNNTIRRITPAGVVTTFAGTAGEDGSADGTGAAARFNEPQGIGIDAADNLYVSDYGNSTVRKITPAGVVSTFAGTAGNAGSADGSGGSALFRSPDGIAVDSSGNVYVADGNNATIRKITPAGVVSTLAGTAQVYGNVDATGSAARFNSPTGVAVDASGNVFVTEEDSVVRRITPAGVVTTIAGMFREAGSTDGVGPDVRFTAPHGIAVSESGILYIADSGNNTIRKGVLTSAVGVPNDYDGDGTADLVVFRPAAGTWSTLLSSAGFTGPGTTSQFGQKGDLPVPGDYDGDGTADLAIYRPANGTWFIGLSGSSTTVSYQWGFGTDTPVPGDFDGDSRTDLAVFRPSTGNWHVLTSTSNFTAAVTYQWGSRTDVPVPGDYDGDGQTDLVVYRPSTGTWYVRQSSSGYATNVTYQWGVNGDVPVPGDYDGDSATDLAVWRPGTGVWYINQSTTGFTAGVSFQWGLTGDVPAAGDFDGDGETDLAVYRPANGTWFIAQSTTNYASSMSFQWGSSGDIPPASATIARAIAISRRTVANLMRNADLDGDGRADLTVYRPSTGVWFNLQSGSNYGTSRTFQWGLSGDIPVPSDYDDDGATDVAVYRPSNGNWSISHSSTGFSTSAEYQWGLTGDLPVPGDYDGDGRADLAVYRPSGGIWFILTSTSNYASFASFAWGSSTDVPMPGDYDGDAISDLAVYRPATGEWLIKYSSTGFVATASFQWGLSGDIAVPGDYDGDGKTDLGVYRPSTGTWYVLQSSTGYTMYLQQQWGVDSDVPVAGDFDGDGRTDFAVFRSTSGTWYLLESGTSSFYARQWGASADIPILKRP